MPKKGRKRITPIDIADAFCKVTYGQSLKDVAKGLLFHGKPPEETDDISDDDVEVVLEDLFGEDFFEDQEFVQPEERPPPPPIDDEGVHYDGTFYRFDGPRRPRRPKTQRVASEYAEWFRIKEERAWAQAHGYNRSPPPTENEGISVADACKVLGVPPNADMHAIKTAFRRLARKWHPDVCEEGPQKGEEMFKKVSEAYECLCKTHSKGI